jgi:hypothetical protein
MNRLLSRNRKRTSHLCCPIAILAIALISPALPVHAGQMDFDIYRMLDVGMTEAELLVRAGPADHVIFMQSQAIREPLSDKQLIYIPKPGEYNPQLTIITIHKGRISALERTALQSPPGKDRSGQMPFDVFQKLEIGMAEGELIALAGPADTAGFISDTERQLIYLPAPDEFDPHLTVITTSGGKIIQIEREKVLSK